MNFRFKRSLHVLLVFSVSALFFACATEKTAPPNSRVHTQAEYETEKAQLKNTNIVSPGFILRIKHSADASISGDFEVAFNGELSLPYKVMVQAAGQTSDELRDTIARAYSSYFKNSDTVSVEIVKRRYRV